MPSGLGAGIGDGELMAGDPIASGEGSTAGLIATGAVTGSGEGATTTGSADGSVLGPLDSDRPGNPPSRWRTPLDASRSERITGAPPTTTWPADKGSRPAQATIV